MISSVPGAGNTRAVRQPFWYRMRQNVAAAVGLELTHSQKRYGELLQQVVRPGSRWLDVGCGRQILPDWAMPVATQKALVARAGSIVGIDVDAALAEHSLLTYKVKAFGSHVPFRDGSFDLVTANMVVEHVDDPVSFLSEVHRLLRPGGRFVFHTTNFANYLIFVSYFVPDAIKHRIVWILERRRPEDIFPTYYRMNTVTRIETAAGQTGFTVESLRTVGSVGAFQSLGPVGVAEIFLLKLAAVVQSGRYNSNIICVLRREQAVALSS
jgi:2-polyprenyl-3-methyl-5-hydroxy-6-metoxy-1,4-benzoquinol methylase